MYYDIFSCFSATFLGTTTELFAKNRNQIEEEKKKNLEETYVFVF